MGCAATDDALRVLVMGRLLSFERWRYAYMKCRTALDGRIAQATVAGAVAYRQVSGFRRDGSATVAGAAPELRIAGTTAKRAPDFLI